MSSLIGRTLGQYEIRGTLGQGGMASVYLGYQSSVDRQVAVKVLPPHPGLDKQFIERFEQEAKTIAKLQHPHILPLHDYGATDDNILYLIMPYVDGGALDHYMVDGRMESKLVERILKEIAGALDYAHRQGVIHRDIKPANILLDKDGNTFLADFGIAKLATGGANLTGTGVVGTPAYMSPEQAQGLPFDHRTDIYALGVVIYEMITGKAPFTAETPMQVLLKHINEPPPNILLDAPDLPPALVVVMHKVMAKNPDDRYQSASAFAKEFSHALTAGGESLIAEHLATRQQARTNMGGASTVQLPTPQIPSTTGNHTVIVQQGVDSRLVIGGFFVIVVLIIGAVFLIANMNRPPEFVIDNLLTNQPRPTNVASGITAIPTLDVTFAPPINFQDLIGEASFGKTTNIGDTLSLRVNMLKQPQGVYVAWLVNTNGGFVGSASAPTLDVTATAHVDHSNEDAEDAYGYGDTVASVPTSEPVASSDAVLKLGVLAIDPSGSGALVYTDADGRFLPMLYNQIIITDEAETDVLAPSSAVYTGEYPIEVSEMLKQLFVESETGFRGRGLLESALAEVRFASQHAGLAAQATNITGLKTHAEHTLNILLGGTNDFDGNGQGSNPGTGVGIETYLTAMQTLSDGVAVLPNASSRVRTQAEVLRVCLNNVRTWTTQVVTLEQALISAETLEAVTNELAESTVVTGLLTTGIDQNENGQIEPFEGECALEQMNTYSTLVASMEIVAVKTE